MFMDKFAEYKAPPRRLGIDDLRSEFAFHGNSQGDDSVTNSVDEFILSKGWKSVSSWFENINYKSQDEVNKRVLEIKKFNIDRINQLKESGEYGKLVDGITMLVQHDPLYDNIKNYCSNGAMSYRFEILNLNK